MAKKKRPKKAAKKRRKGSKAASHLYKDYVIRLRAQAEADAELYVGMLKRTGSPGVDRLSKALLTALDGLLRESFAEDARYCRRLADLAVALALDPAGVRRIDARQWKAVRSGSGQWALQPRSALLPDLPPPTEIPEPLIQEIVKAVFSDPRDLDRLRRVILEVLPRRERPVTLREFLKTKGIADKDITATKDRWRKAKVDVGATGMPGPAERGRSGQSHKYHLHELEASWRRFRSTDSQ